MGPFPQGRRRRPWVPLGPLDSPWVPLGPFGPLVPFGSPWVLWGPIGSLWGLPWVPLAPPPFGSPWFRRGPLGSLWGSPWPLPLPPPQGSAPCRVDKRASRKFGGGTNFAGESILGRRHARKRIWIFINKLNRTPFKTIVKDVSKTHGLRHLVLICRVGHMIGMFKPTFLAPRIAMLRPLARTLRRLRAPRRLGPL